MTGDRSVVPDMVCRPLIASGKVTYDLLKARGARGRGGSRYRHRATRERYYPFPSHDLADELSHYPVTAEPVWVQEEPSNMGAWPFVRVRFMDGDVPGYQHRALG